KRRHVARDHRPGADHRPVADRHTGENDRGVADPDIVPDGHRTARLVELMRADPALERALQVGKVNKVVGRDDLHVGPKRTVTTDDASPLALDRYRPVDARAPADLGLRLDARAG